MPTGGLRCPKLEPGLFDGVLPGSVAIAVGTLDQAWIEALRDAVAPGGRVLIVNALAAESGEGLDSVIEDEKLIDFDLLVVAPDTDAGRVMEKGQRTLGIFQPPILVLARPLAETELLDELGYIALPGPPGVILLAADDADDVEDD